MIRDVTNEDAATIAEIYNFYVTDTVITFEESTVDEKEMESRIVAILDAGLPWIVWEDAGSVVGYAYATPWRKRIAYRFTVETAIYLDKDGAGNGIGSKLYADLIEKLRKRNMHAVMGMITIPNPASIRLHEKLGFEKVAEYPQVGRKFDRWIDVGCWQLLLD